MRMGYSERRDAIPCGTSKALLDDSDSDFLALMSNSAMLSHLLCTSLPYIWKGSDCTHISVLSLFHNHTLTTLPFLSTASRCEISI